ncbi:hypothetical protein HI914_03775 [Erysiphe necator]|nr:hypothetical protein HI914_03775 [Erysiphe necator]
MIDKTRSNFHTPENYLAYLMEWRSKMLPSTIEAHPEKDLSECLEMVIDNLQKVHQGLVHNYKDCHSLPGQLISACQGVEACSVVLVRHASTFEGVASDLRSAVSMWMRTHTHLPKKFNILTINQNIDGNDHYYVGRKYIINSRQRGNCQGKYSRRCFQRNNGHSVKQQKKCFVCGKPKF